VIYLYLFALVLGGILLGASMLLGGSEGDGEAGHAADSHADVDGGHVHASHAADGHAADGHDASGGFESFLVAFLSMRFWTFFLAFFGLTGIVLDGFGLVANTIVSAVIATAMGAGSGASAVWIMRRVRADDSNSAAHARDFVGKTGRVMVGFGPGQTGKVRVEVRGSTIDVLAIPIDATTFGAKEEVIIVEMEGMRAKVARLTPDRLSIV
jgi:membrane protein implicated in regulation of membrane protease activity